MGALAAVAAAAAAAAFALGAAPGGAAPGGAPPDGALLPAPPAPSDSDLDRFVSASNALAVDFYRHAASGGGNVAFSPPAVYLQLMALYEGARGGAAEEMSAALGIEPDAGWRRAAAAAALGVINRDESHVDLDVGIEVRPGAGLEPDAGYLGVVQGAYGADVRQAAAGGRSAAAAAAVDSASSARMAGTLGLVLHDYPESRFHRAPDFVTGDNRSVDARYMVTGSVVLLEYARSGGAQVLKIPYLGDAWADDYARMDEWYATMVYAETGTILRSFMGDGWVPDPDAVPEWYIQGWRPLHGQKFPPGGEHLTLMIVLPEDPGGLAGIEGSLSQKGIESWSDEAVLHTVTDVEIPEFEILGAHQLRGYLAAAGAPGALYPGADLGGAGRGGARVGEAAHDARFAVDREGTDEAAGVTVVSTQYAPSGSDVRFLAHHPFMFVVQDEGSGMILFMGRVSDPSAPG